MASAVGQSVLVQAAQASAVTTPEMLRKAKEDLLAFFKGDGFEPALGSRSTFKDALVGLRDGSPADAAAFLATLIDECDDEGHFDKNVADVYFAEDVDQVAFVQDVIPQMIAFVEEYEQVHGAPVAPTAEEVAGAKDLLLSFILSNGFGEFSLTCEDEFQEVVGSLAKFKELLATIKARAGDELEAFLVNHEDCPGYAKLFDMLIRDAVEQQLLDQRVSAIYFNPKMDTLRFIEAVLNDLG